MENFNIDIDDYALSFSDDVSIGTMQKLQSALAGHDNKLKAFAANVLIGNIPAKKINESVGEEFILFGFHVKSFKFKDNKKDGKYTVLFGTVKGGNMSCAYCSSSDKIYEAVMKILYIYGDVTNWDGGLPVKIRMNIIDGGKAYCLEVV
jgi:hypothetical protein